MQDFVTAPKEETLLERWGGSPTSLTVICSTYQHGDFIESTLNAIMAQETSFGFKVVVRDDGSSDSTRSILLKYAERYPSLIRVVQESEKTYPSKKAWSEIYSEVDTEFVALCDGDDLWINSSKLEIQVRALRATPWASYCHHQALKIDEKGKALPGYALDVKYQRNTYSQSRIGDGMAITSTIVHRSTDLDYRLVARWIVNEDELLRGVLLTKGGALYLRDSVFAAYRLHSGGVWSSLGEIERHFTQASSFFWIGKHFSDIQQKRVANRYFGFALRQLSRAAIYAGFGGTLSRGVVIGHRLVGILRAMIATFAHKLVEQRQAMRDDRNPSG